MIVGDTALSTEIHLDNLTNWLIEIERTELNVNPYEVFDAFCVFIYLFVRFKKRKDPFLEETIDHLWEYQEWLMKNNFWLHIRQVRNITVSPDLVVIGRSLARREFL
jgi:hypothetical protein